MRHKSWDINENRNTGRFKNGKPIIEAIFQNGLNDIEPDGSFVPCNTGISEVTEGVTHLKMNRGRMGELRFGDSGHSNSFLVKIKNKALKGVSFKYTGADGESMTSNNGKPLCHFDNGVSIESTPYYKGVKMDIIINDPLTAPLEYPFSIKTYGQDYSFIEENGGATLKGEDHDPIFIKPPYAVDANGDIGPVTIHYTGMDGNLITFKKAVDETWFRQAAAPVRIDPDVTIKDGVDGGILEDAMITENTPTLNWGGSTFTRLGKDGAAKFQDTLFQVDLSAFSGIESVISAHFGLNIYSSFDNITVHWYEVLIDWVEGTAQGSPEAGSVSWNDAKSGSVAWTTGGCKGAGTDRNAIEDGNKNITGTDSDWQMTISNALAYKWATDANNGVIAESVGAGLFSNIRSSETAEGLRPYFYMEYTEADGAAGRRRRMLIGRN